VLVPAIGQDVQNGETIRLFLSPAVADIDADIVAGRHRPAKLAIKGVVVLDAGQHRHGRKASQRIMPGPVRSPISVPGYSSVERKLSSHRSRRGTAGDRA